MHGYTPLQSAQRANKNEAFYYLEYKAQEMKERNENTTNK